MNATVPTSPALEPLPTVRIDKLPILLLPALGLIALPLVHSFSTWVTLTFAGLAMGMIIFIIASGLTLVFGLMDDLNFGHGVFITLGAFVATTVMARLAPWADSLSLVRNLMAVVPAMAAGLIVAALVGLVFERLVIRPVYGQPLRQIMITMGGMIIGVELIKALWGAQAIPLLLPEGLRGSILFGDAAVEKYRIIAVVVGLAIFGGMLWVLGRTKVGLLIRAGVQDREMVESLGYRIGRLFIVIIIGGLGSVGGCFIGSLLVGLVANYAGFLAPKVALFSNILLMVAVLMWRPQGLYPVVKR